MRYVPECVIVGSFVSKLDDGIYGGIVKFVLLILGIWYYSNVTAPVVQITEVPSGEQRTGLFLGETSKPAN